MEFKERQAIYMQIADMICERILGAQLHEGDKVPSIRETAVSTEVNPNTVTRTYAYLQEKGVIQTQRGIGYFVAPGAASRILGLKRTEFLSNELPRLFRTIDILHIDFKEIEEMYHSYLRGKEAS